MASQAELVAALRAVGMSAARAQIGGAVGMAESGGNLQAHNAVPPDDSYGPWQINMIGALGPARRAAYGLHADSDLFDLATSARVVKAISHSGADWSPWSTFTSGAYKTYMDGTVADTTGFHIPNPLKSVTEPWGKIIDAVEKTAAWVSNAKNWLRVLYVAGGALVALIGLDMYLSSTGVGKSAIKVGRNVATGTAALA